jgi:Pectate lyase
MGIAPVCYEQTETGRADTQFIFGNGTTFSNVIIGLNQADCVYRKGIWYGYGVIAGDVC